MKLGSPLVESELACQLTLRRVQAHNKLVFCHERREMVYSEAIAWRGSTSRLNFSVSKREGKWDGGSRKYV